MGEWDLGFLISDFGLGTLLRSVSVNLAELRRAPATGGWGFPRSRDALTRGFGMLKFSPQLRDALTGKWLASNTS